MTKYSRNRRIGCILLAAVLILSPAAVPAMAAEQVPVVEVTMETVANRTDKAQIYKLVFSADVSSGISTIDTWLSFDNTLIQPVRKNNYADVTVVAKDTDGDSRPLSTIIADYYGDPYNSTTGWYISGTRTTFSIELTAEAQIKKPFSGAYLEFYFRLADGKSEENLNGETFKLENISSSGAALTLRTGAGGEYSYPSGSGTGFQPVLTYTGSGGGTGGKTVSFSVQEAVGAVVSRVYNGAAQAVTVTYADGFDDSNAGTITVYYEGVGYDRTSTAPENAGTYKILAGTAGGTKYGAVTKENAVELGELVIAKGDPSVAGTFSWPDGLSAEYGPDKTIASVPLTGYGTASVDGAFEWTSPDTTLGGVGEKQFGVTFTPRDTNNYETVTYNVSVTVTEAEQDALIIAAPGGTLTYPDDTELDLSALTSGGSGIGAVSYYVKTGPGTIDADGVTLSISGDGDIVVYAEKESDGNYKAAVSGECTITVGKKAEQEPPVTTQPPTTPTTPPTTPTTPPTTPTTPPTTPTTPQNTPAAPQNTPAAPDSYAVPDNYAPSGAGEQESAAPDTASVSYEAARTGADEGTGLVFETPLSTVAFDSKATEAILEAGNGTVTVSVALAGRQSLAEQLGAEELAKIGGRPVYDFTVTVGGTEVPGFGGGAATVTIPYTPQPGEDINSIVIYHITSDGKLKAVRGNYNEQTGTVTIEVSHFSKYAIGYNYVAFKDVAESDVYKNAIAFIAAREITLGTGGGRFDGSEGISRGMFLVMLLRAYDVEPEEWSGAENFSDAGETYYSGYLAAARRLGIAAGTGGNRFEPERAMTRQEMFVLVYKALGVLGKLPEAGERDISQYRDGGAVAPWAREATEYLIRAGTISGDGESVMPEGLSTRAQMAQILYNILRL